MAVEYDANGTPILTNDSLISDVPPYTQALAAANIMPVGAILPYMSATAPDYWLLCDGSQYDPDELPELAAVNNAFHPSHPEFRVPDLRGRSPIGTGGDGVARAWSLGERWGDQYPGRHSHHISFLNDMGGYGLFKSAGSAPSGHPVNPAVNVDPAGRMFALPRGESGREPMGDGLNYQPSTGVNFIVYAGRSTAGITPVPGGEMPAVTTRMMIEARLAEAGIGEEEVKMLKEQLAELKEQDA